MEDLRGTAEREGATGPARAALSRDRLVRLVLVLLALVLGMLLFEGLIRLLSGFGSVLLLFLLAWLLALALSPAARALSEAERRVRARLPARPAVLRRGKAASQEVAGQAETDAESPDPTPLSTLLVYLGLLASFVVALLYFVPVLLVQIDQLRQSVPALVAEAPRWIETLRSWGARYGLAPEFVGDLDPQTVVGWLQNAGTAFAQNALAIVSGLARLSFDLLMVLTLSFYMLVDGARLVREGVALLPADRQPEARMLVKTVSIKFGGFLRMMLIQSALFGLTVLIVMTAAGLPYSLVITLLTMILMLIPIVGGAIAIYPPVIVALFTQPLPVALIVFVVLWIFQIVLYNGIMPRLADEVVGLHPLLAFAALLVGGVAGGGWGALFSVPVAAALAAVLHSMRLRQREL